MAVSLKTPFGCSLFLVIIGCSHTSEVPIGTAENATALHEILPFDWHDKSTGRAYGIGIGWSIVIVPAEYKTVTETTIVSDGPSVSFIIIPPEYEWVKENSTRGIESQELQFEQVRVPATYETGLETIVLEPKKIEYHMVPPKFSLIDVMVEPAFVIEQIIPAVTKQEEILVEKTAAGVREKIIPKRPGYKRVISKPGRVEEDRTLRPTKSVTRKIVAHPYKFEIRNPDGVLAYTFDNFAKLTEFTNSFKQVAKGNE